VKFTLIDFCNNHKKISWLTTWNKKEKENIAIIATSLPYLLVTISSICVRHVHEVGFELEPQFRRQKKTWSSLLPYHPGGCGKADTDAVPAGQADSGRSAHCCPGPAQGAQAKGCLNTVSEHS
jgi:hypothetical protein